MSALLTAAHHFVMTLPSLLTYMYLHNEYRSQPFFLNATEIDYTLHPVVVLIHGRGGHPNDFYPLIGLLEGPKYTIQLGDTHYTSVQEDADKVQELLNSCPPCRYVLVGLSKGGNVAVQVAQQDERVQKVITISSPLKGTRLAPWLFWSSLLQSDFAYQDSISSTGNFSCYHVVPKWDHLVIPTDAAVLDDTPKENIYYYRGNICHQGILHDSSVLHVLKTWILE